MEIAWSSSRRRSDALDASTWRKVSPEIISLTISFQHVLDLTIAWTRVHAIDALRSEPAGSDAYRVATRPAKQKPCGYIVPHGGNDRKPCA